MIVTFIYFLLDIFLFFFILYSFFYFFYKFIRFIIKNIFFFNIWFFLDGFIRNSANNSCYNSDNYSYILDYGCFEFNDLVYYDDSFNNDNLHWMWYYDFLIQYLNVEDDEHELFAFLSTYLVPLCDKFYIIEYFYPDETESYYPINFYDINDLRDEFSFFYESNEYDSVLKIYQNNDNYFIETYYNLNLNSTNFMQTLSFNEFKSKYERNLIWYFFLEKERKETFLKKRDSIPFEILEKPMNYEFQKINYVEWLRLTRLYNENKFKLDHYNFLCSYDLFDKDYYLIKTFDKVINTETKYSQFYETKDEYFLNQNNKFNHLTYYFDLGFFFGYEDKLIDVEDYDGDENEETFYYDGCFFDFWDYSLGFLILSMYIVIINSIIFFFLTCWICLSYGDYIINYELHFSYIRNLTRGYFYNDFSDFRELIFNESVYLNPFLFN